MKDRPDEPGARVGTGGRPATSDGSHVHHARGDTGEAEEFWEAHYRRHERVWSGRPNPVLVDVVGGLRPGTALDLGCGEGGDAIWLALRGWRVTAVDVSVTALDRVATHASEAGVADRVDLQQHDLAITFPEGSFELVSAQYLHSPVEFSRERVLQAAARALAPGGMLLIVDHASVPPWSWADPDTRFPTPEEALAALGLDHGLWRSQLLCSPEREATGPGGQTVTVTDNVVAVRRSSAFGRPSSGNNALLPRCDRRSVQASRSVSDRFHQESDRA